MSTDAEKAAFKEKLKSINFGIVPGAARDAASTTMHDREAIKEQFGDTFSRERVEENRSSFRRKQREFLDETG